MKYSPKTHKTEFYLSAELHKMGMWYEPVIPVLRRWWQKEQKFKIILNYVDNDVA